MVDNMMKKVLFDGTATQSSSRAVFHGGGEYAKFMLKIALHYGYKFDVVFSNKLHTDDEIKKVIDKHKEIDVHCVECRQQIYQLIEEKHYDVFYSALPASYVDYNGTATLIGVIHGLRGAELPWDYYRYKYETKWYQRVQGWLISHCSPIQRYLKREHVEFSHKLLNVKGAKFIAVSNHTKNSLLAFYPELSAEDIAVYYSPFSIKQIGEITPKKDYFLMVSGNRFEKNIYRAVCVFDKLFTDGRLKDKKVVITGCGKQSFWKEIRNKDRFVLKPYVTTEELDSLYMHSFCFVYPSLNEGFGYPPLQAMVYGTPVIASSATSIPEVCDDAACYFSPTNEDDLASRILRMEYDARYRSLLVKRGLKRVEELHNKQTLDIEEELKFIFE